LLKYNSSSTLLWEYDCFDYNQALSVISPVVDQFGNIIISGRVNIPQYVTYQYRWEAPLLAKISASGILVWDTIYFPNSLTSSGVDIVDDLKIDINGNIFICGATQHGSLTSLCGEYGGVHWSYDAFLAKFSTAGVQLWDTIYGNLTDFDDIFVGIGLDNSGNCYVTGYSYTVRCSSSGHFTDFLTIKYNPNGSQLWLRNNGDSL